jgi:hypothetical protein
LKQTRALSAVLTLACCFSWAGDVGNFLLLMADHLFEQETEEATARAARAARSGARRRSQRGPHLRYRRCDQGPAIRRLDHRHRQGNRRLRRPSQRQVGQTGVLPGESPGRFAVPRQVDNRKCFAHGFTFAAAAAARESFQHSAAIAQSSSARITSTRARDSEAEMSPSSEG